MSEILSAAWSFSGEPELPPPHTGKRQAAGATTGNSKPSAGQGLQGQPKAPSKHEKKNNLPQDFDIDMDNPETERAAVAIQSQFRKFQKKKQDVKS